jgi:hypothetical protein
MSASCLVYRFPYFFSQPSPAAVPFAGAYSAPIQPS